MGSCAEMINARLKDPCVSFWLKDAIAKNLNRDIVDVLGDIEELHRVFEQRYNEIKSRWA